MVTHPLTNDYPLTAVPLGLDSYNAQSVIESLSSLARTYNRTVILTIHQPRSGIVALFDQLIVLARGRCVWSGPMHSSQHPDRLGNHSDSPPEEKEGVGEWLESIDRGCPVGFNMADYLSEDLTLYLQARHRLVAGGFSLIGGEVLIYLPWQLT